MGSESNDPTAFQSSIALLQERFRQLQRVKKMREEKELLIRKGPETKRYDPITKDNEPMAAGIFFHFLPPKSPSAPLSSPWSDSQSRKSSMESKKTPVLMSFLPVKAAPTSEVSSIELEACSDCDDVDTSLHL